MTNWMRLRHHHRQPITQPSHHHRHGLDTLPALHPGGEPGTREAQAEPEPAPSSTQAVNAQQRPAETRGEPAPEDTRKSQHPAEAERTQGQQGSASIPPAQGSGNACTHAEPAPSPAPEPAPPPTPRKPTIWRGREGRREGARRKSQHDSAAQHLHPMKPPPRRSSNAASRPSIPGQTASPGECQAPGEAIPLLWSMRNYP